MHVLKIARTPAPSVGREKSIRDAVEIMAESNSGALVVMEGVRPVGVVSERDVVLRAVREGLDPVDTPVGQIMSAPIETVPSDTDTGKAISAMTTHGFRHLVVTDPDGRVVGLLSSRETFQEHLSYLLDQLLGLESFLGADGPGG